MKRFVRSAILAVLATFGAVVSAETDAEFWNFQEAYTGAVPVSVSTVLPVQFESRASSMVASAVSSRAFSTYPPALSIYIR